MNSIDKQKLVIAANFTVEPLQKSIAFWTEKLSILTEIEFSPYNQVFQQLLDPASAISQNRTGFNFILLKFDDWYRYKDANATVSYADATNQEKLEHSLYEFAEALESATRRLSVPTILVICPPSPHLGKVSRDFLQAMLYSLQAKLANVNNLHWVTPSDVDKHYPVVNYYNEVTDKLGHIPYSELYFAALGTSIVRKMHSLMRSPYKVIALDCDQTIWSGICGEDGWAGVKINSPQRELQKFMLAQKDAGMLLCLCSKNVEDDAIEVFERHPDMLMRLKDLVSWRINWIPKSENIKSLAKELNLGLDSFIFVDDNPVECSEVKLNCPEVLVLQIPREADHIPRFLNHIWAFDHPKVTTEDAKRTLYYQQNMQRERLKSSTLTFSDFLENLELEVNIATIQLEEVARVSQLTKRTNQFNATTVRRTESEITEFINSPLTRSLSVKVKDRFGDYGLVGIILATESDETTSITVDTFLLSCRVLGRGVEHRMVAHLANSAKKSGLENIILPFIPSAKNRPVAEFLSSIGKNYEQFSADRKFYKLPVEFAAQITFFPENDGSSVDTQFSPNKVSNHSSHGKKITDTYRVSISELLSDIANHFYSGKAVLAAVEQSQQSSRLQKGDYLAPQSPFEISLTNLWEQVLNVRPIGLQDNFFDLGGTSLSAVMLLALVEEEFGVQLPLTTMLESNTVKQLAKVLSQPTQLEHQRQLHSIVPIHPVTDTQKPPLFMIHGGFGDVLYYRELVDFLKPDQPLYGLQPLGLNGEKSPLRNVKVMASHYIDEIRQLQPEGPYFLGGRCMGAILAVEMAQQLEATGQTVKLIALLQPAFPAAMGQLELWRNRLDYYTKHYFMISATYHYQKFLRLSKQEKLDYIFEQLSKLLKKILKKIDVTQKSPSKVECSPSSQNSKSIEEAKLSAQGNINKLAKNQGGSRQALKNRVYEANLCALQQYSSEEYHGNAKVVLFIANETSEKAANKIYAAWNDKIASQEIDFYKVPGNYDTMTNRQNAAKMVDLILRYLKA